MGGAAPARSERHSVGTERNGIDIILRPMANGLEPPECNLANIDHPAGISHRDQPRVLPRTGIRLAPSPPSHNAPSHGYFPEPSAAWRGSRVKAMQWIGVRS